MSGPDTKISNSAPIIAGFRVQTSAYGRAIPRIFGKTRMASNMLWYGDFTAIPHTTSTTSGGKGGGGSVTQENTTYTYTAAVLLLLGKGVLPTVTKVWRDKEQTSLAELGLSLFTGTGAQNAFSHLATNHPSEALAYRGLAYVATAALDLGDNAQLQNHSFEIEGELPFSGSIKDSNPKDVIVAVLDEAGIPGARVGDLTPFSNYCVANGIFVSPAYTEQKPAHELIAQLTKIGNAEIVLSEDKVKLVPYSDEAKTGNGATFTPNATPIFEFTTDDFLAGPGEEPIEFVDEEATDAFNVVKLKFYNRDKDYNEDIVEAKDDDNIALFGERPMEEPISALEIVDPAVARLVVQNELQRQLYFRLGYRFKLGSGKADLLEPMDPVAITYAPLDLAQTPVRIKTIEEIRDGDKDGYSLEVREYPAGAGAGVLYPNEAGNGYSVNFNAVPGNVNTPVILDAPAVVTDSGFELWLAISAVSPNWGGAQVWVATDPGGPYKMVGSVFGPARHGVLMATFPAGSDPDTVNDCDVDLTVSRGSLGGGTQVDADNLSTLSWIEGELISFEDATLTAQYQYSIETYIRRGVFNTVVSSHAAAQRFVRLDQALFRYPYDPLLVGKTLYVKLPSFNIFGAAQQSLDEVSAYTYAIGGPIGAPDAPTGFTVQQVFGVLNFRVDPVEYLKLDRVEIRFADPGELDWNNGIPVTNILRGNTDSNGSVQPGTWRFMARSFDRAGNPSKTWAVVDFTVSAENLNVITAQESAPGWVGRDVENWLPRSEDVADAAWTKSAATATANQALDYFGFVTLAKLQETATTAEHYAEESASAGMIPSGQTVTLEVQAAQSERGWLFLSIVQRDAATVRGAFFDLANGVVGTVEAGVTARMSRAVNGGYKCVITAPAGTGGSDPRARLQVSTANNVKSYAGSAGSGIFVGNVQLVKGSVTREHAPTGAAALTTNHGNFIVSLSAALIPDSLAFASDMSDADLWDKFNANPQQICTYTQPELDKGIDATARIWSNIVSALGPGELTGTASPKNQVDYRLAAGSYDGFEDWIIGNAIFRFCKSKVVVDTSVGVMKVTAFQTTIDAEPRERSGVYTTDGTGQVNVVFSPEFHVVPAMTVTPVGAGDVSASFTALTRTGFTGYFKTAGAAAAGQTNYRARGP